MQRRINLLALTSILISGIAFGQGAPSRAQRAPDLSQFTGVWRGQMDGLPALTLVLADEGGSLSGAMLFYLHQRMTSYDLWTSTPELPEPAFHLQADGKTLTFQLSHRRAHPPRTLSDPAVTFTLTLTGKDTAQFVNASERGPMLTVTRSDY
jgi:hypothetical protein